MLVPGCKTSGIHFKMLSAFADSSGLFFAICAVCDRNYSIHDTSPFDGFTPDTITVSKAKSNETVRKTVMEYVKGCDIFVLSKYNIKKIADGRIAIADGLKNDLSYEVLSEMFEEARVFFTDGRGKTVRDMPSAEIFVMTKKIDKKKYIIGVSCIKRIAGEPSGKTGAASWFESSTDKAVEVKRFFAEGFEKEMEIFDQSMIDHFKSSVGSGQICEAEYQDKIVSKLKSKSIFGIVMTDTVFFIAMVIIWGLVFKNFALGICFALCFTSCFTVVTGKTKSVSKVEDKAELN